MNEKYNKIIEELKTELSTKSTPGPILDEIMFRRLEEFSKGLDHNHDLLMVGAILGDIRIDEAKALGNIESHVELAMEYAQEIYKKYDISEEDQEVINEVISTHHGGEQKFNESKIYKNADNFKFLETRGCMHFFGALYSQYDAQGLSKAASTVKGKLEEKLNLTDLSESVIEEANELFAFNSGILDKILDD